MSGQLMTGGVAARPVRAPASARAVGAAVKSNSAFAPRARPARRSLRFAVRAGVKQGDVIVAIDGAAPRGSSPNPNPNQLEPKP